MNDIHAPGTAITWHDSKVAADERAELLRQRPATVWLTGLSGAGKSTLAFELERSLLARGRLAFVLDGDNVRHGLNRDLGFSDRDRNENIRRVAEVARLFNEAGLVVITSFISPYRADRAMARDIIGGGRFFEIHLCAGVEVCEARDPKGLYRKARAGLIAGFTGVSAPYEAPQHPELSLDSGRATVEESVAAVLLLLEAGGEPPAALIDGR